MGSEGCSSEALENPRIGSLAGRKCYSVRTNKAVFVFPKMLGDCKECGCQCSLCNTNSLDLHHDIEVLKASLKESRLSASSLKNELKQAQETIDGTEQRHQLEINKINERYDRLLESHRRLETTNHYLEDKILTLVQENDTEREATMAIHENIHKKLKEADKKVEDTIHEKDTLAAQCKVVIDLLKKYQSGNHGVNSVLISKEVFRLSRTIQAHEVNHPVLPTDFDSTPVPRTMPISTFPPCAMMFDHSPKPIRKHLINNLGLPRNASDSRLAKMATNPTNIKLCSRCKEVGWTREFGTQTLSELELINTSTSNRLFSQTNPRYKNGSGVFDV